MEKLSWMFELLDKMSGPANKIASTLKKLDPTLKSNTTQTSLFSRMIGAIGKTFGPQAAGATLRFSQSVVNLGDKLKFLKPVADKVGDVASKGFSVIGKGALVASAAIATVVAGLATAGAALGAAGANWAVHFLEFKEDSIAAFKAMTGSRDAADRIFNKAVAFASVTPFKESDVVAMTQALATRGFGEDELDPLMKGVGDVGAMLGNDKMQSVINALGKMRANGKLTGDELQTLADAGINAQLVFDSLGKSLGKSKTQLQAMMAAGKISDAQGIQATLEAIQNGLSGGKLGGAMEEKSKTLTGLLSTLQGRPEALMAHADMKGMMEPIKGFIKLLIDNLSPESPAGKKIIGLIELIGNGIGRAFGTINSGDFAGGIKAIVNVVELLVKAFVPLGKGFGTGLARVFAPVLKSFEGATPKFAQIADAFETAGDMLGFFTGIMITVIGVIGLAAVSIGGFVGALINGVGSAVDYLESLDWGSIGISIVEGIIEGLLAMISPLSSAAVSIGSTIIDAVEGKLKIGSPSKVFHEIGLNTGLGYLGGLKDSGMAGAMAGPVPGGGTGFTPAMQPSEFVAGAMAAPSAQGRAPITITVNMQVLVDGDDAKEGESIGKKAATSFKATLASEFAKLGL